MQQLRVYPNDLRIKEEGQLIDLYKDDPIKLTLSVEDITNADATSAFSKTFRVPGTRNNNKFFKHAFLIDGIDYDVTVKKSADVLVDGAEFRTGHIRLQKIYINQELDKIEYEIIFLGETRDFSTKIGDLSMNNLNIPELQHALTTVNVVNSWQAFPQGADGDGLFNGDVLYPLIDHGNTYEDGVPQENRISMEGSHRFTQNGHPITPERFKPMIRAKRLWDKIFEDAGYTYNSTFLNGNTFRRLYVSAFGNDASVTLDVFKDSINNMEYTYNYPDGFYQPIKFALPISDPGDNLDLNNYAYIVPITGTYTMEASLFAYAYNLVQLGGGRVRREYVNANIEVRVNGTTVAASGGSQLTPTTLTFNGDIQLNAGDVVQLWLNTTVPASEIETNNRIWKVTASPGVFNPTSALDKEYKQIDFIKDILTLFRLVMSPDPYIPNRFNIEPYIDYVNTGTIRDWSDKLIRNKDRQIQPLFDTQTDRIEFRFTDDGDYVNKYHKDAYQNPYGYLAFDSGNDLLKGTRKIDVQFAPTPVTRIEGAPNTSSWIIPHTHTHEAGDNGTEHLPIKCKTRLLFYNGLKATDVSWYLTGSATHFDEYPAVTPYENFPQTETGLNLNWFNDVKYWGSNVAGYQTDGITLFQRYWSSYITDLYNTAARRVTAYFTLNNVDLQGFAFNDVIFLDGVYYKPERIVDAPIGEKSQVKVELIKALDFRPDDFEGRLVYALQAMAPPCFGDPTGSLDIIIENGIPPFAYQLSNGETGQFASTEFTIANLEPNTYSIMISDGGGSEATSAFIINEATEITVEQVINNEYPDGANNGGISVIPSGGVSPYSILWNDSDTSFTRVNLSGGVYTYVITDANGCTYNGSAEVLDGIQNFDANVSIQNNSNCNERDGSFLVTPFGGIQPYVDITFINPPTDANIQYNYSGTDLISAELQDIEQGSYQFTAEDSNGTVIGPTTVVLECFDPAWPINLAEGYNNAIDACLNYDLGYFSELWADNDILSVGVVLYASQSGAQASDPNAWVFDDFYSDGTNVYEVVNGTIISVETCGQASQVYQHQTTSRYFNQSDACNDGTFSFYPWSACETLELYCTLFYSENGAATNDFEDMIPDGWYNYDTNSELGYVSFEVSGGTIIQFVDC